MKRTLNYTERKKIGRERIEMYLNTENGNVVSFTLSRLDLNGLDLPGSANVFTEAYYRTELKRFNCGNVSKLRNPFTGDLREMVYPQYLRFRILVVDTIDGRILAHADKISFQHPAERKSILPVEFKDLGNEMWSIEYEDDEGGPILCINNKIPNVQGIAQTDPSFFIFLYPAAFREILTHMIFVDGIESMNDPAVEWHANWLTFSRYLGVEPPVSLNPGDASFDRDDAIKWIDENVKAFCDSNADWLNRYVHMLENAK